MIGKALAISLGWIRVVVLVALIVRAGSFHVRAGDAPYPVAKGTDVVASWEAPQRLYVKGNIGVGNQQLQELERWMDQYARNWTAVLVENADGETFTDAEGHRLTTMVIEFRTRHLDGVREGEKELAGKSYAVNWIGKLLDEFSDKVDAIAIDAVASSTSEQMVSLNDALSTFAERVGNARMSALRLEGEGRDAIAGASDIIADVLSDIEDEPGCLCRSGSH